MTDIECTCEILDEQSAHPARVEYCPLHLAADALFKALEAAEWVDDNAKVLCPSCLTREYIGSHLPDCRLAAALKAARGEE